MITTGLNLVRSPRDEPRALRAAHLAQHREAIHPRHVEVSECKAQHVWGVSTERSVLRCRKGRLQSSSAKHSLALGFEANV
jgi:hypothetical protein